MKITLVISSLTELPGGGAERVISNMANFWADTEHKVTLITFDNGKNPYYLLSKDVKWVALDFLGSSNNWFEGLINNLKRIFKLRNAIAHSNLGVVYNKLDMYEESIEASKQAIKINPDCMEAHSNLGVAYINLKDRGSAMEQYKILKKLDTELANKLFNNIYK